MFAEMEILDMFSNFILYILKTTLDPYRFFQYPARTIITFTLTLATFPEKPCGNVKKCQRKEKSVL